MSKYPNKRMMYRQSGRFAKIPPIDALSPRKCASCANEWYPFDVDKVCPRCGSRDTEDLHDASPATESSGTIWSPGNAEQALGRMKRHPAS